MKTEETASNHEFIICAYRESPYLEACIRSLKGQSMPSKITISTSTPNDLIRSMCEKYDIPLRINRGVHGITQDWNFALSGATEEYITLAHQDDLYDSNFASTVLKRVQNRNVVIAFTDYYEIRNGQAAADNQLLRLKRLMNLPFRLLGSSRFIRRCVLSFGNPICCPAVTFHMEHCSDFRFDNRFQVSCDWEAWSRLAEIKGDFVYIPKPLVGHRIHPDSETTAKIAENLRYQEDYIMFHRFWPAPVARMLMHFYARSMESNAL